MPMFKNTKSFCEEDVLCVYGGAKLKRHAQNKLIIELTKAGEVSSGVKGSFLAFRMMDFIMGIILLHP